MLALNTAAYDVTDCQELSSMIPRFTNVFDKIKLIIYAFASGVTTNYDDFSIKLFTKFVMDFTLLM